MPSFLSICLTLLRIAISTTNVIQGLLIELHSAVEWLRDGQYPAITPSTEDQSSNLSLTEPPSSDAAIIDKVAPSKHSTGPSDFTEISSTRKVFARLNRQSTLNESEKNSESLVSFETKVEHDLEDYRYSKELVSRSNHFVATQENNSSKFQENEMSNSSSNEPGASITIANENVSSSETPTEVMSVAISPNSENAVDKSEVEASNEQVVNPSAKQVETTSSEILGSSVHSTSSMHKSQIFVSSKESNIDDAITIKELSESIESEPKLISKKLDIDVNIERHLQLGDYDMSTLRETESNVKSPVYGSFIEQSIGKQDTDLQGTHLPVTPSPPKRMSERTVIKAKDDSFIPSALDQSLCLPLYRVDRSTGNVQWKTDVPLDSTSEPKGSSPYKNDSTTTAASYNKQGFKCEFQEPPATEEILYKPIPDSAPTTPSKFPLAESSTDNNHFEDTLSKSYQECTATSTALIEFKPVSQRRRIPAARFTTRLSTDTEEDNEAIYDPMLDFRHESPTVAEVELKSARERRPPPRIMHHEQTSSSGRESGIFSEPNSLKIFVPVREESRPLAFRSPLKSQEGSQSASVKFIDQPLLTKNNRIDSMEKIEFPIKPTSRFISTEAIVFPQSLSQISSPLLTDSDTPENIKYIEKASELLITVSTHSDKDHEYCDINSSATEFPVSGSPSATDSEEANGNENLPHLLTESPSSIENGKSPTKECKTPSSVRFQLSELHIEGESKGIKTESKFRKPPNETSTSEEENEIKRSRKRRASPGKFYKSPKKFAETTASKIKGYKFSPQKVDDEKKREEGSTCENTSATRSLDFELGIQQKCVNAANLPTSADQKNLKLESEQQLSPRKIEDQVSENSNSQQVTSKSESTDDRSSTADSKSETTSSARIGDDIAVETTLEGSQRISLQRTDNSSVVADCIVDSDKKGNYSALESTKEIFPSIENGTFALQENAHEADSTFKDDASNKSLVKGSTNSDKSREISFIGHLQLLNTNKSSQESKSQEIEFVSDQNNEEKINEKKIPQLKSTSKLQALSEHKQNLNCSLKLEATVPTPIAKSSQISTSSESSSDETVNEKSGRDSSREGAADLASQLKNRREFEKSSNADRTEDKISNEGKSESSKLYSSDKSPNKELVKNSSLEADTDNFIVHKNIKDCFNLVCNVDSLVEIDKTLNIGKNETSAKVDVPTELREVLSNSTHPVTIEFRSEDQIPETEQQLEMELSSSNKASFATNRLSALSPVHEVSANGTASSISYSESETANNNFSPSASASEEECVYPEQASPLSKPQPRVSPKSGYFSSETENAFSNLCQMSTSKGENIQFYTTTLDPAEQSRIGTGEIISETETGSSFSTPSKSSNSEVDEENTLSKVAEGTLDYHLSTLNKNLTKYPASKSYFSPVLEELVQRIKSASRSNSPIRNPLLLSPDIEDGSEVSSDLQLPTAFKTNVKKVYNAKNYFDTVLKEIVQRVKSATVSDSFTSIKEENNSVPNIEVSSKISIQTSPRIDFMAVEDAGKNGSVHELSNDIILNVNETEMKNVEETVHSDNLITGAENIQQDNLEFELHIVPQPVPCETAIESNVKVLISNENSSDQNVIKIVDSEIPENELNAPDVSTAESTICQQRANPEKGGDSCSRCPVAAVSNESTTVETLASTENLNLLMLSTIEAFVKVTNNDSTANIFIDTSKGDSTEKVLHEITKDEPSENILETTNKYHTENTMIKVTKEYSTENISVEITKEDSTENTLVETTKEGSTENNLVDVSKDDPTEIDVESTNCSYRNTFVEMEKDDSTKNDFVELMHGDSIESNAMNTSTTLDSSVAEEASANDKEESSKENKPWKKKQRKLKKKRRN